MPPKKKEVNTDAMTSDQLVDLLGRQVEKDYGEGVFVSGQQLVNEKLIVVPISPALDVITSGGIEEGSWLGITGNPKTGKSVLALSIAANCQRPEYGGRPVYYMKAEGRLSTTHLKGIEGLDLSPGKFTIIQSREGLILTAQDFLRIGSAVLSSVPGACLIIDSASALCDEAEMTGGVGTAMVGGGNKTFAQFVRTNAQVVPINKAIVIVITHLIANIGGRGYNERSARAVQYQYDTMLRTKMKEVWKGTGGKQVGLNITWACNTSKLGPPGMTIESKLRFGVGIDRVSEAIELGKAVGLIKGAGWLHLDFLGKPAYCNLFDGEEPPKANGVEKMYAMLREHPEWLAALNKELHALSSELGSAEDGD